MVTFLQSPDRYARDLARASGSSDRSGLNEGWMNVLSVVPHHPKARRSWVVGHKWLQTEAGAFGGRWELDDTEGGIVMARQIIEALFACRVGRDRRWHDRGDRGSCLRQGRERDRPPASDGGGYAFRAGGAGLGLSPASRLNRGSRGAMRRSGGGQNHPIPSSSGIPGRSGSRARTTTRWSRPTTGSPLS